MYYYYYYHYYKVEKWLFLRPKWCTTEPPTNQIDVACQCHADLASDMLLATVLDELGCTNRRTAWGVPNIH